MTKQVLEDFLDEAIIMKDFDHKNVLHLIGVYIEDNRPFVVFPFMPNGDLKSYVADEKRVWFISYLCATKPRNMVTQSWLVSDLPSKLCKCVSVRSLPYIF